MHRHSIHTLFFLLLAALLPCRALADLKTSLQTLSTALYGLESLYVENVDIDSLTEVALRAALSELDPHTNYMSQKEYKSFREGMDGSFEGIGVSFRLVHDTILVIRPVDGGPSQTAGILPCDQIISADGRPMAGQKLNNDSVRNILRGPEKSIVRLGVKRRNCDDLLYFDVCRGSISVSSVTTSYMVTPTVGYLAIERFAMNTGTEAAQAISELKEQGMQDLILDLQGNGGGYLQSAVRLAELFLPSNSLVVYTQGRNQEESRLNTRFWASPFQGRLVVLMDEQSASASEILAGAIQDYDRGLIIGRRSFGKGLVQRPIELPNGGMIRLTISHYYTPSGRCIQKPYEKGQKKAYQEDLLNRLHNGELVSADSIHLADSLKYFTKAGRVVYGGGGIMPDIFVPLDTTRMSPAHRAVTRRTTMLDWTLNFYRLHQPELEAAYPTLDAFADDETGFHLTDEQMAAFIDYARQDSVTEPTLDSLMVNKLCRTQVEAYIANNMYDKGGYRRVINRTSDYMRQSLSALSDANRYDALLASPVAPAEEEEATDEPATSQATTKEPDTKPSNETDDKPNKKK